MLHQSGVVKTLDVLFDVEQEEIWTSDEEITLVIESGLFLFNDPMDLRRSQLMCSVFPHVLYPDCLGTRQLRLFWFECQNNVISNTLLRQTKNV